jgi:hypothetical protein
MSRSKIFILGFAGLLVTLTALFGVPGQASAIPPDSVSQAAVTCDVYDYYVDISSDGVNYAQAERILVRKYRATGFIDWSGLYERQAVYSNLGYWTRIRTEGYLISE